MENTRPMDTVATSSNESEQSMNMVAHDIETLKASEERQAPDAASSSAKKEEKKDDIAMNSKEDVKEKEEEQEKKEEEKKEEKKKTMADFGYYFNEDGKMRTIEGDAGFTFTTQKDYEALGDAIGEVVYEMMEKEGLERRWMNQGRRFYFASPGYEEKERILVLIHGSGVVKAGQWARKLIINESLSRGTQLDYIKRGLANGWGIVVLNYNEKCAGTEEKRSCHDSRDHGIVEWEHAFDAVNGDADILIVAHSAGGDIASHVVHRMHKARDDRVLLVCCTDSWFSSDRDEKEVYSVNWNTNKTMKLRKSMGTWQMYSGDDTHEGTSAACFNSCFALMEAVRRDTSVKEFEELLKKSEEIVFDEYKVNLRRRKEEQRVKVEQARLELEQEMKEKEKKKEDKKDDEENEKNEDGENKSEGAKKETTV